MYTEIQKLKAVEVLNNLWFTRDDDYFFGQRENFASLANLLIAAKDNPHLYTAGLWWQGISIKLRAAGVNILEADMANFYDKSCSPDIGDFDPIGQPNEGSFEFLTEVYDTIIAQTTLQDVNLEDFL